jgi:hypothetical protein
MEYVELTLDSQLAQNSGNVDYVKTDWPVFNLGQRLTNIQAIKLVEVCIPKTWYNWYNTDGDLDPYIVFQSFVTDVFYFMYIPTGSYTIASFITAVNAELSSTAFQQFLVDEIGVTGPIDATLEYNTNSGKFKFVFSGGGNAAPGDLTNIYISFFGADQPINYFMGYPSADGTYLDGTAEEAYQEMPEIARVDWPNYLQVASSTFGDITKAYNPLSLEPTVDYFGNIGAIGTTGQSNPQFGTVPNDKAFGQIIVWQDPDPGRFFMLNNLFQLASLDIYLTNGPFTKPLRLNGQTFMVKIGLLVDKPNK